VFTAGALDLKIDSQSHYNGMVCTGNPGVWTAGAEFQGLDANVPADHYPQPGDVCGGTWAETDLGPGLFKFFDFADVKPGDDGENTISLHVTNNDAWGCFLVDNVTDEDVTCTEPESEAEGDVSCSQEDPVAAEGELGAALSFDAWLDQGATPGFQCNNPEVPATAGAGCAADPTEGDNVFQVETEGPKFWEGETLDSVSAGPFDISDVLSAAYVLESCTDATGDTDYGSCHGLAQDGRMVGSATYYFGLAWNIPAEAGNEIQSDQLTTDMIFEIVQHRNNPDFTCTPRDPEPETATVNVDKVVTFTDLAIEGVDVSDFTLTIDGPGDPVVVTDNIPTAGLPVGTYSISEVYSGVPANVSFNATFSGGCSEVGDSGVGTMEVVAGVNPTCVITNAVSLNNPD